MTAHGTRFTLFLALLLTATYTLPAMATPIILQDEEGDGRGPGSYRLPRGPAFRSGAFDLTRVTLTPRGDTVEIRARVRTRLPVARHARVATDAQGDYPLLQLDIYVDHDRKPGSGMTRTVPGRRVIVDESSAWEHAVVITALPGRVRSALSRVAPSISERTYIAAPTRFTGSELVARVPASALGGTPQASWGYTVLATSVTLSTSVRGVFMGDGDDPVVYTREITVNPGTCENWEEDLVGRPCTFGGCDPCEGHPRVLDAIVTGSSAQQLKRYRLDRLAVLHAMVPDGTGPKPMLPVLAPLPPEKKDEPLLPVRCTGGGRFLISDRDGEAITIVGKDRAELADIGVGRIATLIDKTGRKLGRAVLTGRKGTVCMLERLEAREAGAPMATMVAFDCRD